VIGVGVRAGVGEDIDDLKVAKPNGVERVVRCGASVSTAPH
jgi:hypothetical protein